MSIMFCFRGKHYSTSSSVAEIVMHLLLREIPLSDAWSTNLHAEWNRDLKFIDANAAFPYFDDVLFTDSDRMRMMGAAKSVRSVLENFKDAVPASVTNEWVGRRVFFRDIPIGDLLECIDAIIVMLGTSDDDQSPTVDF